MAYHNLTLDLSKVETLEQFYGALKTVFKFNDTYELNTRDSINFLSNLRYSDSKMSKYILPYSSDTLILEVKGLSEKSKSIIHEFVLIIEAVNYKELCKNENYLILLNLIEF